MLPKLKGPRKKGLLNEEIKKPKRCKEQNEI